MSKVNQDELFRVVEYSADAAERIGYSNYSYWRSVWQNFLKKKSAVFMAIVFIVLGVMNGGLRYVLVKAINICTECIGLG